MAKINQYTPSVLGWVAHPSLQAHRYGCCNDDHEWDDLAMPIPYGELPTIQLLLEYTDEPENDITIELYNENDELITNLPTYFNNGSIDGAISTSYFISKKVSINNEEFIFLFANFLNSSIDIACGKYYIKVSFNDCNIFSNLFKVVPQTCCLHMFEFINDCDRDGIFAQMPIDYTEDYTAPFKFTNKLYIDGCNILRPEEKIKEKRTLLLNGCYRTDEYEIFEMFRLEVPKAFHNLRRAVKWMGGFDNVRLTTANGLLSDIQNLKIENERAVGKRKCFDKFDIIFEDNYLNPTACCFDYASNGYPESFKTELSKYTECGESCYLSEFTIEDCGMEFTTISYYSTTGQLSYTHPVTGNNIEASANPFTIDGLEAGTTYTIEFSNKCGTTTEFEFTTKSCQLSLPIYDGNGNVVEPGSYSLQVNNKNCENSGSVSYSINLEDIQGNYHATITNIDTNEVINLNSSTGTINLEIGNYEFSLIDDICLDALTETFEIVDDCECFYDIEFSAIDCSCFKQGGLVITINSIVSSGSFDIVVSNENITDIIIPSTALDTDGTVIVSEDNNSNPLQPGTYSVKLIDGACESVAKNVAIINDTCVCNPPTLLDVNTNDITSSSVVIKWNHAINEPTTYTTYCIRFGSLFDVLNENYTLIDNIAINPNAPLGGYFIDGLTCGTEYYVSIQSKCSDAAKNKESDWTDWISFYTNPCSANCDDDDLNITIGKGSNGETCLTANAVNTNNGTISWSTDNVNYTIGNEVCGFDCELVDSFTNVTYIKTVGTYTAFAVDTSESVDQSGWVGYVYNCSDIIVLEFTKPNAEKSYLYLNGDDIITAYSNSSNSTVRFDYNYQQNPDCNLPENTLVNYPSNSPAGTMKVYCCQCPLKVYFKLEQDDCPTIIKCAVVNPDGTLTVTDYDPCEEMDVTIRVIETTNDEICVDVTVINAPSGTTIETTEDINIWTFDNPYCISEASFCEPLYQSDCPATGLTLDLKENTNSYSITFNNLFSNNVPLNFTNELLNCEGQIKISFTYNGGNYDFYFAPNEMNNLQLIGGRDLDFDYDKIIGTYECQDNLEGTIKELQNLIGLAGTVQLPIDCVEISCCDCPQIVYVKVIPGLGCPEQYYQVTIQSVDNYEITELASIGGSGGTTTNPNPSNPN